MIITCKDCGKQIDRHKFSRRVRCEICRMVHETKKRREYYEAKKADYVAHSRAHRLRSTTAIRPSEKLKLAAMRPQVEVATLLKAHTQNTGPRGFAELVNKLIRGEK